MTIQIPENLARDLEGIAAERNMTVERVALDRLRLGGRPIEQLRPVIPGCDRPADAVVLWRYMDLGRFLSMLRCAGDPRSRSVGGELYFNRLREFLDSWEAALPSALALYPHVDRGVLEQLYARYGRNVAVSCWHEGSDESVAMWRLYTAGAEGVAIKTTVGELTRALRADGFDLRIARVSYIGDSQSLAACPGSEPHGLEPVYCKRLVYRHEREVRVALIPDRVPGDPQVEQDLSRGFSIRVDLTALVRGVVVSDRFPEFAVPVVQEALGRAGVSIPVRLSAINRGPLDLVLDP